MCKYFFPLFLAILPISVSAQSGSVTGTVLFEGKPVSGATVRLGVDRDYSKGVEAKTNSRGEFVFEDVQPGSYTLWAFSSGKGTVAGRVSTRYLEAFADVVVAAGARTTISIDLKPTSISSVHRVTEFVTISADAAQPIDEVAKTVSIITGQEMRDRADITLADSLRTVPGFRVQQLGGFGRTASIKSRGLRNQDTAILIDGVRLRDAASITGDATAYLSDLTLTSVSKVEVLRGPGSSLYGTNAIGGTVNLETPTPQTGWHGQVSGAFGGLGLGRFRGNVSKGTRDGKFGINAAFSRTVFTKGIDGDDDANNTNLQSRLESNPLPKTNISARIFLSDAFVKLNSSPDTFGPPPAANRTILDAAEGVNFVADTNDPDATQRSKFFSGQIALRQIINSRLMLQGHYSGLTTRRTNDNGILGAGFQSASTSIFDGTIHTANGHFEWIPNTFNRLTAGYEFELETFRNEGSTPSGSQDFFTAGDQSSHVLFFQDLISLLDGKLQFAGGIRAQFFQLGPPGFSVSNAPYSTLTLDDPPSAVTFDGSSSYYISRTGTKFRAHAGSGYRVPSLYERFGTFFNTFPSNSFVALGDPFLKPERTLAFDAGVDQNFLARRLNFSGTFFYTKLADIIGYGNSVPPIGSTPRPFGGYENQRGGVARGAEFSAELKPANSTSVFVSYTFTNSDQLTPQVSGSAVYRTLGIPAHQFTLNATQRIKNFWINADVLATSSYLAPIFSNLSFNSYVYRFEGNRRVDVTAGHTFSFDSGRYSFRVFGTVENVFDNEYFENGFRTPGRTARIGTAFAF